MLISGFATTIGWPLTTWLNIEFGWRGACLAWAGIHLLIALPLNPMLPGNTNAGKTGPVVLHEAASGTAYAALPAPAPSTPGCWHLFSG